MQCPSKLYGSGLRRDGVEVGAARSMQRATDPVREAGKPKPEEVKFLENGDSKKTREDMSVTRQTVSSGYPFEEAYGYARDSSRRPGVRLGHDRAPPAPQWGRAAVFAVLCPINSLCKAFPPASLRTHRVVIWTHATVAPSTRAVESMDIKLVKALTALAPGNGSHKGCLPA